MSAPTIAELRETTRRARALHDRAAHDIATKILRGAPETSIAASAELYRELGEELTAAEARLAEALGRTEMSQNDRHSITTASK
ncbi:hypothetical protein GCM10009700_20320 [Brevibacterium sanguinis]|uniref:hypothetical protein n=1 Tax=Brevibacterium sanguinis TaxID=232444 RepID=UPI0031E15F07